MTAKRLLAVLLSLGLALPAIADVHVITRTNTSGQTVTSAVTPGVTTVTGCTNEVLYGDASDLVGCEGALAYDAGTNTLTSSGTAALATVTATSVTATAAVQGATVVGTTSVSTPSAIVTGANGGKWTAGIASEALTLDTGNPSTDTTANLLPANSIIDAVTYRITTTITTSVSFTIGDASTVDRFCTTQSVMTAGTTGLCFRQHHALFSGDTASTQDAAAKIRVILNANPGAGVIRLQVHYRTFTPPTS